MTLGDAELAVVSDGPYVIDGGSVFGIVPKVLWEKRMPADALNRITCALNCLLIRTAEHTVLVDTGIGNKLDRKTQEIFGFQPRLLQSLEAAGVAPGDVDVVINTHLHLDHCGWNTVLEGGRAVATFPRARYVAQQGEVRHAKQLLERDRGIYLADNFEPLLCRGQMELVDGDTEIVPGIEVKLVPGHTARSQAVIIRSKGATACFIGDLVASAAHLDLTWGMAFDLFPLDLIASRKAIYQRALQEKWLVIFPHDPNVPWGYLHADARGKLTMLPPC